MVLGLGIGLALGLAEDWVSSITAQIWSKQTFVQAGYLKTRPDTRLPLLRAGGQGQGWRRSLEQLGRSGELKTLKKLKTPKKFKWVLLYSRMNKSTEVYATVTYEFSPVRCPKVFYNFIKIYFHIRLIPL